MYTHTDTRASLLSLSSAFTRKKIICKQRLKTNLNSSGEFEATIFLKTIYRTLLGRLRETKQNCCMVSPYQPIYPVSRGISLFLFGFHLQNPCSFWQPRLSLLEKKYLLTEIQNLLELEWRARSHDFT